MIYGSQKRSSIDGMYSNYAKIMSNIQKLYHVIHFLRKKSMQELSSVDPYMYINLHLKVKINFDLQSKLDSHWNTLIFKEK